MDIGKWKMYMLCLCGLISVTLALSPPPAPPPPPIDSGGIPPPPPPPPPFCPPDTDDDTVKHSYVNDTCKTDSDCYSRYPGSVSCKKGVCTCNDDFTAERQVTPNGEIHEVCDFIPYYVHQPCSTVCRKPLTCSPGHPYPPPPPPPPPPAPAPAPAPAPPGKVCTCEPPYVDRFGQCYKECPPNEVFIQKTGECAKRCQANELADEQGKCKKVGNLGEACKDKHHCAVQYSVCQSGKCACAPGFTASKTNDQCTPKKRSCPIGQPFTKNGALVVCGVKSRPVPGGGNRPPYPYAQGAAGAPPPPPPPPYPYPHGAAGSAPAPAPPPPPPQYPGGPSDAGFYSYPPPPPPQFELYDNCTSTYFCVITSGNGGYQEGASGYCCPKPKLLCPVGDPHPTAKCSPDLSKNETYCPYENHTCLATSLWNYYGSVCCPLPCTYSQIGVNGRCYPHRNYGDACLVNEQCRGHNGVCQKGVCTCSSTSEVHESGLYKYCEPKCKEGEVKLYNGQCAPQLKLGDNCDPNEPDRCPDLARCNAKSKKCTCACGYIKVDNNTCGYEPRCPGELFPVDLQGPNSTAPVFCQVPGRENVSVSTAVKQCPSSTYCARYMQNAGLCCPKPAQPFCSDGSKPGSKCDPRQPPSQCGPPGKWYCSQYMEPAGDPDPAETSVCCPLSEAPPPPPPPDFGFPPAPAPAPAPAPPPPRGVPGRK